MMFSSFQSVVDLSALPWGSTLRRDRGSNFLVMVHFNLLRKKKDTSPVVQQIEMAVFSPPHNSLTPSPPALSIKASRTATPLRTLSRRSMKIIAKIPTKSPRSPGSPGKSPASSVLDSRVVQVCHGTLRPANLLDGNADEASLSILGRVQTKHQPHQENTRTNRL